MALNESENGHCAKKMMVLIYEAKQMLSNVHTNAINPTITNVNSSRSISCSIKLRMPVGSLGHLERLQQELWTGWTEKEVFSSQASHNHLTNDLDD